MSWPRCKVAVDVRARLEKSPASAEGKGSEEHMHFVRGGGGCAEEIWLFFWPQLLLLSLTHVRPRTLNEVHSVMFLQDTRIKSFIGAIR